jgi:hypothetical protein
MNFEEVATFAVAHTRVNWPWIAFSPHRQTIAYCTNSGAIATSRMRSGEVDAGQSFALPAAFTAVPIAGFAVTDDGARVAVIVVTESGTMLVTIEADGVATQHRLSDTLGNDFVARALGFDRQNSSLWISGERLEETLIAMVDATSFKVHGTAASAGLPLPATHELYPHPQDDAVLLLAACGQEGSFARVVGWSGTEVTSVPGALDDGGIPAGFVGYSADGARVHLAEADELRTHAWPELHELASVQFADDFASSYAGAVLGSEVYVDGTHTEGEGEDLVMRFEAAGIQGKLLSPPFPAGMWAGSMGTNVLVTVDSKGEPARASVLRMHLTQRKN